MKEDPKVKHSPTKTSKPSENRSPWVHLPGRPSHIAFAVGCLMLEGKCPLCIRLRGQRVWSECLLMPAKKEHAKYTSKFWGVFEAQDLGCR